MQQSRTGNACCDSSLIFNGSTQPFDYSLVKMLLCVHIANVLPLPAIQIMSCISC